MATTVRVLLRWNLKQNCLLLQQSSRRTFRSQAFQLLKYPHLKENLIQCGVAIGASAFGTCLGFTVVRWLKGSSVSAHSAALEAEPSVLSTNVVLKHKALPSEKQEALDFVRQFIHDFTYFLRFSHLSLKFGPLLLLYPFTLLSDKLYVLWLKRLFLVVENAGPVFVKLGQWASTRRDLFSKEFCDLFSSLHHHVHPHKWEHTEQVLVSAYGSPAKWSRYLKVDKSQTPLGSGCVAQVYKGYIHKSVLEQETVEALDDNDLDELYYKDGVPVETSSQDEQSGEMYADHFESGMDDFSSNPEFLPVAIKVLHPNIHEQFNRDLTLMKVMARILEKVIPSLRWVNLTNCVEEFSVAMVQQMDMIHEAKCLKRFHKDFSSVTSIRIPVPIKSLVSRNILVESYEDGQPISEFLPDSTDIPKGLRQKLAQIGIDALLQMVFVNNFVHGDLHPGNILVQNAQHYQQEPESELVMVDVGDTMVTTVEPLQSPLRLVLLDCGIISTLKASDRTKFKQVFTAVVKGEGEAVANLFLEKSVHVECTDPEAFRQEMAAIVSSARRTALKLSQLKVSALLSDVFAVLSRHRVKLESNFANIILAIAILEGLGRSLDPELNILDKASTVLLA